MSYHIYKNQKKLRIGYTTGACAAAAAEAACAALLLGERRKRMEVRTSAGPVFTPAIEGLTVSEGLARCAVRKDAGDDPDVTDGVIVCVLVQKCAPEEYERAEQALAVSGEGDPGRRSFCMKELGCRLLLDGGEGVGRVTGPGLEQAPGYAAINKGPRRMIYEGVARVCKKAGFSGCLKVVVSIPGGRELAGRTFNPRLGIEGGLSVLGTTGMVEPMSEKALVATIEKEIAFQKARGRKYLLVTPGNYGREYIRRELGLSLDRAVKCSNFIGEAVDLAVCMDMKGLLLVGDAGKLIKLAAGIFNTHSRVADGRMEVLAAHAAACGAQGPLVRRVLKSAATGEALMLLEEAGLRQPVLEEVLKRIASHLARRAGGIPYGGNAGLLTGAFVYAGRFGLLGHTAGAQELLEKIKEEE